MSTDEHSDGDRGEQEFERDGDGQDNVDLAEVRDRLGEGAGRAVDQFDESLIELLAWMLETETRARIYVSLRTEPEQTSDEIADSTGLYPSTVREALASMHDDGVVAREKRQNSGAGNNPYEYSAIPPSELVGELIDDIQEQLNTVFNLDRYIDRSEPTDAEPVTITVTDHADLEEAEVDGDDAEVEADDAGDDSGEDEADTHPEGETAGGGDGSGADETDDEDER